MVDGIDSFREAFKGYEDCYTVIGGAACDILMAEADNEFRATKDIDMILLLEDRYKEFASVFWEYIKSGKYKCGWKNSEKLHFYRFTEPVLGYPVMIELFSRKPDYHLEVEQGIIPIRATGIVLDAVEEFVEVITDEKLPLIQLGLPFDADEGIRLLKQLYGV